MQMEDVKNTFGTKESALRCNVDSNLWLIGPGISSDPEELTMASLPDVWPLSVTTGPA